MPFLNWISDENLVAATSKLLALTQKAKAEAQLKMAKNVMDPLSAVFQMSGFGMTYDEWYKSEEARQYQKTMQNFVGEFHQDILGYCTGWQNMGKGNIIDLLNPQMKIVAEVKNKHNTVSGGKLADLYWSLESAVMNKTSIYKGHTAYHVSIIPKKPARYNDEFTPSDKEKGQKCPSNPLIREIDGASFYTLVTGENNALKDLFSVLPNVLGNFSVQQKTDIAKLKQLYDMAYGV